MDILIKNIKLPEDGLYEVTICGSGRVFYHPLGKPDKSKKTEAIVLPDHGDLIDRDALWGSTMCPYITKKPLFDAPVVIPKSGS